MLKAFIVLGNSFKGFESHRFGIANFSCSHADNEATMLRVRADGRLQPSQLTESETSGLQSSGGGMIATFKVMLTYAFGLCFSNMYVHAGEPEVHYLRHPLSPEDPAHG